MKKFKIIIPVLNGGEVWKECISSILAQNIQPDDVIVIDSGSTDGSYQLSTNAGFLVHQIDSQQFNHGGTRNLGIELAGDVEFAIFMTQDAILLGTDEVSVLLKSFDDSDVVAAYGRQLPHKNSGPIGSHARIYNYPDKSFVKSKEDIARYGFKTIFISNSFSAYRVSALNNVGQFPSDIILGEDTYTAAKFILDGYKIAYNADAVVYHSHDYSFSQDFKRYFDIGVFHARESWLRQSFGGAEGEGKRFVISEFKYVLSRSPSLVISIVIRTFVKYIAYKVGLNESHISSKIKSRLSMHPRFWN